MAKPRPLAHPPLDPAVRELLHLHGPTISPKTASHLGGAAEGTLANLRSRGGGPVFYRRGRSIRYDLFSVLEFAKGRR